MPNGDVVSFPDDMPHEQIRGMIASKFPDISKTPAPNQNIDAFDTVSDNALQGATFGLGNRAQAGLAALVATGINGKPLSDNYKDARNIESQRLSQEMSQNPKTAIASNIGGALATGGLAADTAPGAVVTDWLGSGGTAARIGKGALSGGVSGAAYGAGTADYGKSLEGARKGAISGAVVGGAIPAAGAVASDVYNTGKNIVSGALAKSPEAIQDAASSLKGAAGQLYDQMRQAGATFKQSATQGFLLPDIDAAVGQNNFIPALNPKTTAIIDDLKQKAASGDLGLDQLDQYRRLLGRIGGSEDGVSAGAAKRAIDDFVNNSNASHLANGSTQAVSLLNKGRQQYAQASKFETVADILSKADGDANKIKSGLKRFLVNNNNAPAGWSANEVAALKNAASTGGTEALLKMGGKFGIDLGSSLNVGNTIGPMVGYGVGGGAAPIAGTVARQAQKWAARGKASNLLQVLESGGNAAAVSANSIAPVLSAPAGGATGLINNMKSRIPAMAPQEMPQISQAISAPFPPQSNASPQTPDLFSRVIQQESGGKQFNAKGNPLISNKGAVGVAQIMPGTAYDAAKAAGLPYDPRKIYTDPEYNQKLGEAYLGSMQKKYGDDTLALMAYNWGPGNVDSWMKRGAKPDQIPAETKNYVRRILGT